MALTSGFDSDAALVLALVLVISGIVATQRGVQLGLAAVGLGAILLAASIAAQIRG